MAQVLKKAGLVKYISHLSRIERRAFDSMANIKPPTSQLSENGTSAFPASHISRIKLCCGYQLCSRRLFSDDKSDPPEKKSDTHKKKSEEKKDRGVGFCPTCGSPLSAFEPHGSFKYFGGHSVPYGLCGPFGPCEQCRSPTFTCGSCGACGPCVPCGHHHIPCGSSTPCGCGPNSSEPSPKKPHLVPKPDKHEINLCSCCASGPVVLPKEVQLKNIEKSIGSHVKPSANDPKIT